MKYSYMVTAFSSRKFDKVEKVETNSLNSAITALCGFGEINSRALNLSGYSSSYPSHDAQIDIPFFKKSFRKPVVDTVSLCCYDYNSDNEKIVTTYSIKRYPSTT